MLLHFARRKNKEQSGSIVVTILILLIFFTMMLLGLSVLAKSNVARASSRVMLLQAQYAAESGADSAIAQLNNVSGTYTGTSSDVQVLSTKLYKSTYAVSVTGSGSQRTILATGKVYRPATGSTPTYMRKLRVIAQSTSATTQSALVARNIIDVDSSVKNISGKDIYANGYINLRSNSTTLTAETVTVAGKDTGASNCSIEGSGHLAKASTVSKATIKLAFNNCINPPGNTSNSTFNVSANQSNISAIQSMYIPWSQSMGDPATDATNNQNGSCTDWTSGASPRGIASNGNNKNTHYPDTGSGVSTSCGTSGNLALGTNTFTIRGNVHVRANLCASSACDPTFNNPTATVKFIYVEGTMNFNTLHTASGSGPIVFVVYGTDPGTHLSGHNNLCPLGDSVYLSKNGSTGTAAPAAFILAMNGVCFDKTKFDASPSLGGVAGKNIWVSSNSGNPFDLYLDPNFPTSSIPVGLYWRATYYERL